MFIKFLRKCGSYKAGESYNVPNQLARVLIHTRKATPATVPAATGTPDAPIPATEKQIMEAPENRAMVAGAPSTPKKTPTRKPAAKTTAARPSRAKKNEYETKSLPAKD